jgi:hypothetical protein
MLWTGPGWLAGARARFEFGPVSLPPECFVDVDRLLAGTESLERELGRPSADGPTVEMLRRARDELDGVVASGAPIQAVALGENGEPRVVTMWPLRSAIARVTGEIGPGAPALQSPGPGAKGEHALTVVALMTSNHLYQVTGTCSDSRTADLLVRGLHLGTGEGGGPTDPRAAMRARLSRARVGPSWKAHRARAAEIAGILGLVQRSD